MTGITVSQAGDTLAAVKRATDPDHRARLRHEAELLGQLEHPGVIRLIDFTEGPPASLRTSFVGPDSWRTTDTSAAGFAALTATVADLHDAGLAHGDLRPDHVLVDADDRPILCGFADAGPATPERVAADRAALATMLRDEAGRRHGTGSARLREAAEALDVAALPTRAAIRVLDDTAPPPPAPRRTLPLRRLAIGAAAVATVAVAGIAIATLLAGSPDRNAPGATSDPQPTAPVIAEPATEPPPAPPDGVVVGNDLDEMIIEHQGRRYGLGEPGDVVVVDDWTCAGEPTPALLRPATGEVVVFTAWPEPGGELSPALTVVIDGAIDFIGSDERCPELRIRTADGSRLIGVPTP